MYIDSTVALNYSSLMERKFNQSKGNSGGSDCYDILSYIYYAAYLHVSEIIFARKLQHLLATYADNLITAGPIDQLNKFGTRRRRDVDLV